jgi:hypothetical protein
MTLEGRARLRIPHPLYALSVLPLFVAITLALMVCAAWAWLEQFNSDGPAPFSPDEDEQP